ncbi:MAG: hydantoinase/oxoprolinase family protein [Gammaproteobacteria bacterium]|nr:hydantoinase/oxoprolinase family protein [Gammaproteobacteria bacterium]MYF51488.1 hydantoinase/oxoprolinase family protein [Gammaproteobacteria bacterium]
MAHEGGSVTPVRIAADIGGTFTDLVLDDGARQHTAKVLTSHSDPADAVLQGLKQVMDSAGCEPEALSLFLHGTTLATNALIERRGAVTALLTTEGHRDAVEMAFENRFEQYDINIDRPAPLVPRRLRIPVRERIAADGGVLRALDTASLNHALDALEERQVESVAIGFLHAYRNPEHERRTAAAVRERLPSASITLSSEVCPEIREYERLSTTCANAYVQPLMAAYLDSLERQLRATGIHCPLLLMTSGGGLTDIATASRFPIRLVESGPAGGALLAQNIARQCGYGRTVSFDMGGTTAKICLIDDAKPLLSRAFEVDRAYRFKKGSGLPVRIPVIEMVEIGAGGGSIAAVDNLGRIAVGPASAGSEPGPAAYGRGGALPTVTDADTLLGRLRPEFFAGGAIRLDADASRCAIDGDVATPLKLDTLAAAAGISEVIDENMAAAARAHAVEWGKDTGARTLIAYGGAAPLHACRVADKLRIDRILIPAGAGVGSALGFLLAPISFEVVRSRFMTLSGLRLAEIRHLIDEMRAEATAVVEAATDQPLRETLRAYMRYAGQGFEIAVNAPPQDADDFAGQLGDAFAAAYRVLYGRTIPDQDIEILSWTLALGTAPPVQDPESPAQRLRPATPDGGVELFNAIPGGMREAALYQRQRLSPGDHFDGPALIVEDQTTTVVGAGFSGVVNARSHLILERTAND